MGFLDSFERSVERAVGGAFAKTFRSGVHPLEMVAAIKREMDSHAVLCPAPESWSRSTTRSHSATLTTSGCRSSVTPLFEKSVTMSLVTLTPRVSRHRNGDHFFSSRPIA